jgi:epsilon-lactone hydrolase
MRADNLSLVQQLGNEEKNTRSLLLTDARPSWQSRCFNKLLRLFPFKKSLASAAAVQEHLRKSAQKPVAYEPPNLGRDIKVSLTHVKGWPVYHTVPAAKPDTDNCVVFLHGGGFINEIVRPHWRFVAHLTRHAHVRCIVPIYPLIPQTTAKELVPATGELLRKILADAGSAKVTVVGNSAGAGLGIAATQWLRDNGYRQPDGLILISPWVNASMDHPEKIAIAPHDPLQDIPGIVEIARLYAGDLDITHRYVSPLYGGFNDLAPMLVFSGTLDLLYPDSVELEVAANAAGVPIELHLRQGQPHNYAGLLPTPEGREALAVMIRSLTRGLP